MAESVVSFVLEKLSNLLSQKYTQLEGLEREVQYIMDELGSMRGSLRDAEAKQDSGLLGAEQQEWIKQMREAAYDIEDIVDEFLLRFAHHGGVGFRGLVRRMYTSLKNLRSRHRISSKIMDMKERVEHIANRHKRYKSTEGIAETSRHPIRGHALLLTEVDLVGIDEPKSEIISLILNDNSHLKAISVVGMGGLGKTTLVKRVYEAPYVKNAFSIHAWLTIAETFRIEDALKDFIRQICKDVKQQIPGELDSMDANRLRAFVRDFLKEKRYIIVIDDLWSLEPWISIEYVFPDDNCGSCIVITTRKEDVATTCCREFRHNVYRMKPLSTNESWNLFCRKTFGEDSCPPHLKGIARNILSKCGGLPLGIVAIGGLLALKDTSNLGEWDMVLRSLGSELEGNGKLTPVTKILIFSYNDLPYHLKSCLLYMSIFPEHANVVTEELAFLWIAEGFVEVRPGMTAMEVALGYLNELICRSLIQVAKTELDGRVRDCRVHGLIYKIIISKCREHNILTPASTPYTTWPEKVRRVGVDDSTCPKEPIPLLHLRSLFVDRSISASSLSILLNGIPNLLKVLELLGAHLSTIPQEVFKLSNLTYLNLANTEVTNIPKSIGKLQNLQYLNLGHTNVKELPVDIIKLKKLCFLKVYGKGASSGDNFSFKAPYKLGGLFSLQYLKYIEADSKEVIREIGKLTQLRELGITGITRSNGRELCSSLKKLTKLEQLYIGTNEVLDLQYSFSSTLQFLHNLILSGPLVKVPDWVPSCHGLSTIYLFQSNLREDPLGSLEGLPNLLELRLLLDVYEGDTLHFKARGFQKLKFLKLVSLSALKLVIMEEGTLSDLETLEIDDCMLLEELPLGIQYLRKLRSLKLYCISMRLQNKLHSQKNDGHLSQITEIHIGDVINGEWKLERLYSGKARQEALSVKGLLKRLLLITIQFEDMHFYLKKLIWWALMSPNVRLFL